MLKNSIQNAMINQLKNKNPEMYNFIMNASKNGVSFKDLVKQKMKSTTPEMYNSVVQNAKNFGMPDEILQELESFKD